MIAATFKRKNMSFDFERREQIFGKTDGDCHICGKKLAWSNYGIVGARAAWEVEHSVPRSAGGTDRPEVISVRGLADVPESRPHSRANADRW